MKRLNLLAIFLFLGALAAIFTLGPAATKKAQSAFLGVISPFLRTGSDLEKRITAIRSGLKTLDQLEVENRRLSVENKELRAVNTTLRDLETENNSLRRALQYRERAVFRLTADGLELIELAPGVDLQTQVLDLMEFRPRLGDVRPMSAHVFEPPRQG